MGARLNTKTQPPAGFAAFGINIGNLGKQRRVRVPMPELVKRINRNAACRRAGVKVVALYGHSGNFVLATRDADVAAIGNALRQAVGVRFAVVPLAQLREHVRLIQRETPRRRLLENRWTPGISLYVGEAEIVESTRIMDLSDTASAVWKLDAEVEGRLDSANRRGGWGAVATATATGRGGVWTARSLSTVRGLLRRASEVPETRKKVSPRANGAPSACPVCASERVVPILYGMPSDPNAAMRAEARGELVVGGCVVFTNSPKWSCAECEEHW